MQSKFRQTIISPGGRVEFRYPDDTPAYRRGFTPSGGAKLHFRAAKTNSNPYVTGKHRPKTGRIVSEHETFLVSTFRTGVNWKLPLHLRRLYNLPAKMRIKTTKQKAAIAEKKAKKMPTIAAMAASILGIK